VNLLRHFSPIIFCLGLLFYSQAARAGCISEPMMQGQDPQIEYHNGTFYLVQSDGCNVRLRQSSSINGLASVSNPTILSPGCSNVWAPEIHFFSNNWYVYYSLGAPDHPNHRVYAARSQTTSAAGPYTILGILFNGYWNIDGSVFAATNGQLYFIFSGSPSGSQQNIYIAPMSNPYTLSGAPVLISAPTLSWETVGSPPNVNEGPFGFTHNGRTFIDYSASGCWTDNYCLGLLTLTGTNLLDPASWTKSGPVFSQQPTAYGPGHNGVFQDGNGQWWNIYHANNLSGQGCGGYRQLRAQRIYWDASNTPQFGVPVPTNSLVIDDTNFLCAQYPLTATSGTNAVTSTCGPAGVLVGAPVWQNPGLKFNGTNDYVDCGAALGNDVQNTLTLVAWIKADTFIDWAGIIAKGINTEPYAMQIWHDGSLRFSANWGSPGGAVGGGSWNSNFKMQTNQWYHVAITYDGATIRFYTNGVPDTYQPATAMRFGVVNESMTLGADLPGGDEYFSGTIRDARVYGRALSTTEINLISGLNHAPVLAPIPNRNTSAGQILTVTNSATDSDLPAQTLTYHLLAAPAGAWINSVTGTIGWRPATAQANSTNLFTVQVTDNGSPPMIATQSFSVVVAPLARPQLNSVAFSNSLPQLRVSGDAGPDYIIQGTTNLNRAANWFSIFTNNSPLLPFYWTDATASNDAARFYRVLLSP
jgi:GH43 family beta-xylosidase